MRKEREVYVVNNMKEFKELEMRLFNDNAYNAYKAPFIEILIKDLDLSFKYRLEEHFGKLRYVTE